MKEVDLEKQTQFLDKCTWDALNVYVSKTKSSSASTKNLSGSLTAAGTIEKLSGLGDSNANIIAWSDEMELRISKQEC